VATANQTLASGATVASLTVPTVNDPAVEPSETFLVNLGGFINPTSVTTTITDTAPPPVPITLAGPAEVEEGAISDPFQVLLGSAPLEVGRDITFTLDTEGMTASEGFPVGGSLPPSADFGGLQAALLRATPGLSIRTTPMGSNGAIQVTLTNTSGALLAAGSPLLSFALPVQVDSVSDLGETFRVNLTSTTEPVINGIVETGIVNVAGVIRTSTSPGQWVALDGDRRELGGIAGTELESITVQTGAGANNVNLSDGVAFATLDTGEGGDRISVLVTPVRDDINDYVQFGHAAYRSTILAGGGNDIVNMQSSENVTYVRSSAQSPPDYERSDYYQSVVDLGGGDDYVYAFLPFQSEFLGGSGTDTAFLYGTFRDWSFDIVNANGGGLDLTTTDDAQDYTVWTVGENISSTARQNVMRGIELLQFNDILLDLAEAVTIGGSASVAEGAAASYGVRLAGNGLQRGQSVAFTVSLGGGTATPGADYSQLLASSFSGGTNVKLDVIPDSQQGSPAPGVFTVVATANQTLASGATVASLTVPTVNDPAVEPSETFNVRLGGFMDPVTVSTTITDNDVAPVPPTPTPAPTPTPPPISGGGGVAPLPSVPGTPGLQPALLSLDGTGRVREGQRTSPYTVSLQGGVLGAGERVVFRLRTRGFTARLGRDFAPLAPGQVKAGTGIQLDSLTGVGRGLVEVTATNRSGQALGSGFTLAQFRVRTRQDTRREGNETFGVDLTSSTSGLANARVRTVIRDDDALPPSSSPSSPPSSGSAILPPSRLPRGTFGDNFNFGSSNLSGF
jgi:hypothetical protein